MRYFILETDGVQEPLDGMATLVWNTKQNAHSVKFDDPAMKIVAPVINGTLELDLPPLSEENIAMLLVEPTAGGIPFPLHQELFTLRPISPPGTSQVIFLDQDEPITKMYLMEYT